MTQKEKAKWDAPFETMGETLQGPYTTVKQEECEFLWENEQKKGSNRENEREKNESPTVHTTQQWKWIINDSRGSNKVEYLLSNNRKTL